MKPPSQSSSQHKAVREPRSSQSEEVVGFREDVKNLDDCSNRVVDLRKRLRKIGRRAGMDVTETGSFPVVPAKEA